MHFDEYRKGVNYVFDWLKVREWSSESSGFSFAFHEFKDVSDSDGSLNVSDKMTLIGLLSWNEDDFDLGDTSSGAGSS